MAACPPRTVACDSHASLFWDTFPALLTEGRSSVPPVRPGKLKPRFLCAPGGLRPELCRESEEHVELPVPSADGSLRLPSGLQPHVLVFGKAI